MTLGIVILIAAGVLIYLGLAHRVLDRLHLSDRGALFVIGLLVVGTFIDLPLSRRPEIFINVGGALVPLGIITYVLIKANTALERAKALIASLVTGVAVYVTAGLLAGFGHGYRDVLEPMFIFAILAGTIAYATGRTRRGAFVAAVGGILIYDIIIALQAIGQGLQTTIHFGGAGVFDTTILAGFLSLGFVEIFGELLERVQKGPDEGEEGGAGDN